MYTPTGRGNGNRNSGGAANMLLKSHPPFKAPADKEIQTFRNYHAEYGNGMGML